MARNLLKTIIQDMTDKMGDTTRYNLLTQAEYEKYAEESYLVMSDGSQLKILRTFAPKKTSNGYTLFVNPAFGSIILGWDEFLNEAMQDFDYSLL